MHKIAKGLIKNLSLIALAIGMIGGFISYDALKDQRAANQDVIKTKIDNAGLGELVGKYLEIQGGIAEVLVTFEYGIGDMGDGEEMLASEFYYPIVLEQGGSPLFLVAANEPPSVSGDNPTSRTGILRTSRDMPDKVASAFAAEYPGTSFLLLDTQYDPVPIARLYINFIGFLLLVVASFFAFRFAVREASKLEEGTQ